MFQRDFIWGAATSAYQIEGRDPQDGAGTCIWDTFAGAGHIRDGYDASVSCDHLHRFRQDLELMRYLGIHHYRFSVSWSRIMPDGTGAVNEKGIAFYRELLLSMREMEITPCITLYHWELPQKLQDQGGWLNPEAPDWFAAYAKVVAENFSDLCSSFITLNEPQCFCGLGYVTGIHAPGLQLPLKDTFRVVHHALLAHGKAVQALRRYAAGPVQIGIAPTCSVALPATNSEADIAAAKAVYFGFPQDERNWAWNVTWYLDPVIFGRYPEDGLKKYAAFLPDFSEEDMKQIAQPLDFIGQNIYNGYPVRAGEDGKPVFIRRKQGYTKTAAEWPVTPECLYWGPKFLYERYQMPILITENGMSCHDRVSADGHVHDRNRIDFLDDYLGELQRAADEGCDIRGYYIWSLLDNFEWDKGYQERFGIVYVDYETQRRTIKDSAYWYQKVIQSNGRSLSMNQQKKPILFMKPVFKEMVWGGSRLGSDFGYQIPGDDTGECWGISAHPNGDDALQNACFAGETLSSLWEKRRDLFGGLQQDRFPLLIKIIDAKANLSIQVHPDDAYAAEHENGSLGKMECWYIIDCPEGAELVVGHTAKTRDELKNMVQEGRFDDLIRRVPIHKGDFIQIDPGTVHAITSGCMLLETQQNSDITYRVYDYGRLVDGKPRQLHVKQSVDVIEVPAKSVEDSVRSTDGLPKNRWNELITCQYYTVYKLDLDGAVSFEQNHPFLNMSVIEGEGILDGQTIRKGDHFILPSGYGEAHLDGKMVLIASTVPEQK